MAADAPAPFEFLTLGAIIKTFRLGNTNIVQSFPTQQDYVDYNAPFFGETIGRVANRISGAKINSLNGKSYTLAQNNGPNSLHGGVKGWGKRVWEGPIPVGVKKIDGLEAELEGGESVVFKLRSEDGNEGYPGTVEATVTYTAGTQKSENGKDVNVLAMEYQVELLDGADETVVNMTNHSYFNLTAGPTIEGTQVSLITNLVLPVDSSDIPTGDPVPHAVVPSTPHEVFTLGPTEPDIDTCFTVVPPTANIPLDTRKEPLQKLVTAYHPSNGNHLEVLSTEPAFQFYTGKYIDVPDVPGQKARGARSAFCVEPSRYVNAPNVDAWRSQVLLKKGSVYGARTVYRGWSDN